MSVADGAAKQARIRLRSSLWRLSSLPSVQSCAKSVLQSQGFVGVEVGSTGAGFTGLQTCSSVSACPCCSGRIREQRAREIEAAGVAHLRAGGQLVFLTFTLPHDRGDALEQLFDTVAEGWKHVQRDAAWLALADVHGVEYAHRVGGSVKRRLAFVRAIEVSHGRSGWHPHLHVLLFVRDVDAAAVDRLQAAAVAAWQGYVTGRGWRLPEQFDAQLVVGVNNAEGLARYLSKIQDQYEPGEKVWGVHREMARSDVKRGKRWHVRSPFQIAEGAAQGSVRDLLLWHEYERSTKGRRIITSSQGLYRHLGVAELKAELAPDVSQDSVQVAEILPEDWRLVVRFRAVGDVLAVAAAGGGAAVDDLVRRLRGWQRAMDLARRREEEQRPIQGLSPIAVLAHYRRARQQVA